MEPRIQYAKTSDGVNIAYAVFGSGPAIVFPANIWGDVHNYVAGATYVRNFDGLAALGWSVVCYDGRGSGDSDRGFTDFSLEMRLRDLEAVVEKTAPERFPLCGSLQGSPTAIAYAVRRPDRVSHLILSNAFAKGEEYYKQIPAMRLSQVTLDMAEDDWEFHLQTLAHAVAGYSDSALTQNLLKWFRTGMTRTEYVAYRRAAVEIDVSDLLPQIRVPTLVVTDGALPALAFAPLTRRVAAAIPHARYVEANGLARVADEFLREGGLRPETPAEVEAAPTVAFRPSSGTAIIMFADIVDSTGLTERLGDTAFREKARELDTMLRTAIRDCEGTPVEGKLLGDGVLAVFTSARQAIEAALRCGRAGDEGGLPLHLGIHAGDVIREGDNVYGGAVNIASRISGLSAPGEVLVSETVRSLARTSAGVGFEERGEQALKGVGEPVRVWAVVAEPGTENPEPAGNGA
jgi:class 3 adenylate cyclase